MATYEFELSSSGLSKMEKMLDKINTSITDPALVRYIAKKCEDGLKTIAQQRVNSIHYGLSDNEKQDYLSNNKMKIEGDTIYLYNDSTIDISAKNMKETTKANYPAQLSLSRIIEYGIGYTGWITPGGEAKDWQYDVNNHGYRGWYYTDETGNTVWTNGFQGRLIYYNLKLYIQENVKKWIKDYIDVKLK